MRSAPSPLHGLLLLPLLPASLCSLFLKREILSFFKMYSDNVISTARCSGVALFRSNSISPCQYVIVSDWILHLQALQACFLSRIRRLKAFECYFYLGLLVVTYFMVFLPPPIFDPSVRGKARSRETNPAPASGVRVEVKTELDWTRTVRMAPT